MREILFRGKNYNREWVYGHYYKCKYYRTDLELFDFIAVPHPEEYGRGNDNIIVIPETVGQFTGLKDANDNDIFEGDIVKEGCNGLIGVVVWCNELGTYRLEGLGEEYAIKCAPIEWEVIGNVHDNPELLLFNS